MVIGLLLQFLYPSLPLTVTDSLALLRYRLPLRARFLGHETDFQIRIHVPYTSKPISISRTQQS